MAWRASAGSGAWPGRACTAIASRSPIGSAGGPAGPLPDPELTTEIRAVLAAGEASLATRPATGEALETERLKARLGAMLLERELLEAKIAVLENGRPLARRRSRR